MHQEAPLAAPVPHENRPQELTAGQDAARTRFWRQLTICGLLLTLGYVVLFCLMQSPALWYPLRPDPVRSLIPEVFRPINVIFPDRWVNLDRTHKFALTTVPIYLAVLALITAPLLFLLKRLSSRRVLRPEDRNRFLRRVTGFTLLIMLVLLFQRGLFTTDIYSYEWYARIWVEYGASPYTHSPLDFPPDPEGSIWWAGWLEEPAVYGPAWVILSSAIYKLGQLLGGSFSVQVLLLRLLADAAHLLNAWLVWSIAGLLYVRWQPAAGSWQRKPSKRPPRRLLVPSLRPGGQRPLGHRTFLQGAIAAQENRVRRGVALQAAALLLYIWYPLMLVEFAGNGHNDVVMFTFVLLAVWLHLRLRWRLASLALGLAVLTKLSAILFLPGYLWLLLWEGARVAGAQSTVRRLAAGAWRGAQALAIIVAAGVVLYIPFWEGPRTLQALFSGPGNRLFAHTLAADAWWNGPKILISLLGITGDQEQFTESAWRFLEGNVGWWSMLAIGVVGILVTWRARTVTRMIVAWGWVALAALFTQGWFWPWYVTWAAVPAALVPWSRRLRNTTLIFSISALLLYPEQRVFREHFGLFADWSGIFVIGPPLLYLCFSWLAEAIRSTKPLSIPVRHKHLESPPTEAEAPDRPGAVC